MSKGLDPEFLTQLKNKIDLVELIGSYVPLERKGGNWWGRCPFHHEKTPSFTVNADNQFYHCFGCGVSGDAITFIREIESVDFVDAVKILAERVKLPMPEMNLDSEQIREQKTKRDNILKILRASAHFYLDNLNSGKADAHIQYILDRKLSASVVRKFGLGASLNFRDLPQFLLDSGFSRQDILDSGAVTESEKNGRLIDKASPEQLQAKIQGKVFEMSVGQQELEEVKEKFEISNLFRKDGQIIVRVVTQKRPEGYNEIREAAPTLEDVYLYEFEVKGAMHK